MKGYLIRLAIRFLLKRLLPSSIAEYLESLVKSADSEKGKGKDKFDHVKASLVREVAKETTQKYSGSRLNTAIELAVLAHRMGGK